MGNRLYLRNVAVTFGQQQNQTAANQTITLTATEIHTRIKFLVEKYTASYANSILLQIYNPSAESRASLQKPGSFVVINAGYDGNLALMATGSIFSARPVREGPDIVMAIEALDNGFDVASAPISVSVGPGGTNQQVMAMALQAFQKQGIPFGPQTPLPLTPYFKGFSFGGTLRTLMNQLTGEVGFGWQILDGLLVIYPSTPLLTATVPTAATLPDILLTPDTGLLEIPSQETPIFDGGRPMYVVKSLLNPELNPNRTVNVQSKFLTGRFQVYSVRHQGDSEEGEFVSNLEVW